MSSAPWFALDGRRTTLSREAAVIAGGARMKSPPSSSETMVPAIGCAFPDASPVTGMTLPNTRFVAIRGGRKTGWPVRFGNNPKPQKALLFFREVFARSAACFAKLNSCISCVYVSATSLRRIEGYDNKASENSSAKLGGPFVPLRRNLPASACHCKHCLPERDWSASLSDSRVGDNQHTREARRKML